ncbi:amidase domain-containing protein [Agromyces endophyticus]|uniref:amidase domain-containing protein n=1 Tax=Agromyces sp. H17E-10 TaxID=2932244 RepID=UPI001FD1BF9A|nr:amidase domain-containing protein [Agromyces sp. H17E-10]UOQ90355.1 amidase domain-containing protein [Agromyces sp. H17E-10]
MTQPTERPSPGVYLRRRLVVGGALVVVLGLVVWLVVAIVTAAVAAATPPGPTGPGTQGGRGVHPNAAALELDPDLPAPVLRQLEYVREYWDGANDDYGVLGDDDCVNFASQSLIERGWAVDDEWWHSTDGDPYASSDAWRSSTLFSDYLAAHPERATPLSDAQRAKVKPGDIVQFDWDASGDRDHTAVVTAVREDDEGDVHVYYAGHTDATWDRSVDDHPKHPKTKVYFWSVRG